MYLQGVSNPSTFVQDDYNSLSLEDVSKLRRLIADFYMKRDAETYRACFNEVMEPLHDRMCRGTDRKASSKQCLTIDTSEQGLIFFVTSYKLCKDIDPSSLEESIRDKFNPDGGEAILLLWGLRQAYSRAHLIVCKKSPNREYYLALRKVIGVD